MRRKGIQIDKHALAHSAEEAVKNRELDLYRTARRQGIQPATTKTKDIQKAIEVSETTGVAYGS